MELNLWAPLCRLSNMLWKDALNWQWTARSQTFSFFSHHAGKPHEMMQLKLAVC